MSAAEEVGIAGDAPGRVRRDALQGDLDRHLQQHMVTEHSVGERVVQGGEPVGLHKGSVSDHDVDTGSEPRADQGTSRRRPSAPELIGCGRSALHEGDQNRDPGRRR